MPEPLDRGRRTRQLRNLVEPIAAAVFFVPEAHDAYIRLGFPPPQGAEDGIPLFDWGAYFVSRAACLGPVHGAVVAAAFGVFEPAWVAHEITQGWTRTDPATTSPHGSRARRRRWPGCWVACRWASTGLRRRCNAAWRPSVLRASRCLPDCGRWAGLEPPWETCGAHAISIANTAAMPM